MFSTGTVGPRLNDLEGATQARTFSYIVLRITKSCSKVLGFFFSPFEYVLERSSEYSGAYSVQVWSEFQRVVLEE